MTCLGVVIVSTPQDVALKDTLKGISMFQKMNINVSLSLSRLKPSDSAVSLTSDRFSVWSKTCLPSSARSVTIKQVYSVLQAQKRLAKSIISIS